MLSFCAPRIRSYIPCMPAMRPPSAPLQCHSSALTVLMLHHALPDAMLCHRAHSLFPLCASSAPECASLISICALHFLFLMGFICVPLRLLHTSLMPTPIVPCEHAGSSFCSICAFFVLSCALLYAYSPPRSSLPPPLHSRRARLLSASLQSTPPSSMRCWRNFWAPLRSSRSPLHQRVLTIRTVTRGDRQRHTKGLLATCTAAAMARLMAAAVAQAGQWGEVRMEEWPAQVWPAWASRVTERGLDQPLTRTRCSTSWATSATLTAP